MKKILSIFLSLVMILTAFPLTAVNSFASNEFYISGDWGYRILDDGTASIEYAENYYYTSAYFGSNKDVVIPSKIDGYTVTCIGMYSFCDYSEIESITIPESVNCIMEFAFSGNDNLKKISVNSKNENFCTENGILFNKEKTRLILCPAKNMIVDYTMPNSVTSIGYAAFSNCSYLEKVTVSENLKELNSRTFYECTSLKEVILPEGFTGIGGGADEGAFESCTALETITFPESLKFIGVFAFYNCSSLKNVVIANSIEYIGVYAFGECFSLEKVVIGGNSETVIDIKAFSNSPLLKEIKILNDISLIQKYAIGYIESPDGDPCKVENFIIYSLPGTEAERYANENGFTFIALEKEPIVEPTPDDPTPNPNPDEPIQTPDDPTPTPEVPADVSGDGKLSVVDAKWILQAVANARALTDEQRSIADVNGDGKVTVVDAKWILQAVAGMRVL